MSWTLEDRQIWRDRQMKPHTIQYRYQTHVRDGDLMLRMSEMKNLAPAVKLVALEFFK